MRLGTFAGLTMVHMSQETSRFAIDAGFHSALLRHGLEHGLGICLHSETDITFIVNVSLRRPETHIVQLLISCRSPNSLKSSRVVHVDI